MNAQIAPAEHEARRAALADRLGRGAVLAFGAPAPLTLRSEFRQLPAFTYLTGFREPDAALVLVHSDRRVEATLFTETPSVRSQLYDGIQEDPAAVARRTGFRVRPLEALPGHVDSLVESGLPLFELRDFRSRDYAHRDSLTRGRVFVNALRQRHRDLRIRDAHPAVERLRARKSPGERTLIGRAVSITVEAHRRARDAVRPGAWEYEVEAAVEHAFRSRGAAGPAFASIVGSGPNSTTLHYVQNDRRMQAGDVVVIDVGAEVEGYAADLTRTLPVSGRFSPEQRALYELVLDAQRAAEHQVRPGGAASASVDSSRVVRFRGLARLGLIEAPDAAYDPPWPAACGDASSSCLQGDLFAIHGISHGIGLEVHDPAGFYFGDMVYREGDALTIEPGLYVDARLLEILPPTPRNRAFRDAVADVVARYDGIGIRIEDDYVVTADGVRRLSAELPRDPDRIEASMEAGRER